MTLEELISGLPDLNEEKKPKFDTEKLAKALPDISNVSTGKDAALAALYAIPKAVAGIGGLPGDVRNLAQAGKDKLMSYLPDWAQSAEAAIPNPVNNLAKLFPTSGSIRKGAEQYTGPWYDPQTRTGKVVDTALQTGAMMGRNWLTNPATAGLITGGVTAGTEGAGAATNDNPWARFFGGVVGGGIPAAANAVRTRPGSVVREAIGTPTRAEQDAAIALQDEARRRGIPLMGTESLDRGHQLASNAYAHPSGNATIEEFLKARPAQVETAVNRDLISTTGQRGTPAANAARAQETATQYISDAERARTMATSPFYQAAQGDVVNPIPAWMNLQTTAARDFPSGMFPHQNRAIADYVTRLAQPEATNAANIDRLYREARDTVQRPQIGATSAEQSAVAGLRPVVQELEALSGQSPNIAQGRRLHQNITETTIDPLTAGPLGTIAGRTGFDAAAASPVPRILSVISDANTVRPSTIRELYQQLNGTDPRAFPGIVQTHLENQLDLALKKNRTGENVTSGAKFTQAIAGTPEQRRNFDEMMRGVAIANGQNPADVVRGANTLLTVLDRTGRTPGIGSQTSGRGEMSREMGKNLVADTLGMISLTPMKPLARRWSDSISRSRYTAVAEALTAPDSVQQLAKMARLDPNGLTASYMAAVLLGLDNASASGQ